LAIDSGYNPRRRTVAWADAAPDPEGAAAFRDRGFVVPAAAWGRAELENDAEISVATAIVLTQTLARPTAVAELLTTYGQRLIDFDCNVIVLHLPGAVRPIANVVNEQQLPVGRLPANEVPEVALEIGQWQHETGDPRRPYLRLYLQGFAWAEIANYESERPAGPAPGPLLPRPSRGKTLDDEELILVRRAFSDCSDVQLTPISGGKSGAKVFVAHASGGRGSLPSYFVKTGKRSVIIEEYTNYVEHVKDHVPFNLVPRLVPSRCGLGAHDGILVGDFVEESEQLLDSARDGRASAAIACLFERTLRGWHRNAVKNDYLLGRSVPQFAAGEITTARLRLARKLEPTVKEPQELLRILRAVGPSQVLWGLSHGDLHASNICVRGTDAILIDFLQCGPRPVLCDPAALEASLLVGALRPLTAPNATAKRAAYEAQLAACRASLDVLYGRTAIDTVPAHAHPKDEWSWFHACVRQIRMHAFHMEGAKGQYAIALAAALLFKAGKDPGEAEPERSSRALAYVYGERLLLAAKDFFPPQAQSLHLPAPHAPPTPTATP
jgi:hypothetical protein